MKKASFFSGCAAALMLLAALQLSLRSPESRVLAELTQDCTVPFLLTTPDKELPELPNATRVEGWGCYSLENKDLSLTLGGYPDVQDLPYCLIGYTLRSPRYTLFDLRVGSTLEEAENVLKQRGYHPVLEETVADWSPPLSYVKEPICIRLGLSEDLEHLSSLTVSIAVTNQDQVIF